MRYIKLFEENEFEIGSYVKIIDDEYNGWIKSGIYGNITNKVFKVLDFHVGGQNTIFYYLDDIDDYLSEEQLELASDVEVEADKYNL